MDFKIVNELEERLLEGNAEIKGYLNEMTHVLRKLIDSLNLPSELVAQQTKLIGDNTQSLSLAHLEKLTQETFNSLLKLAAKRLENEKVGVVPNYKSI